MSKGIFCPMEYVVFTREVNFSFLDFFFFFSFDFFLALSEQRDLVLYVQYSLKLFVPTVFYEPVVHWTAAAQELPVALVLCC